jgi:hypothetical protein
MAYLFPEVESKKDPESFNDSTGLQPAQTNCPSRYAPHPLPLPLDKPHRHRYREKRPIDGKLFVSEKLHGGTQ